MYQLKHLWWKVVPSMDITQRGGQGVWAEAPTQTAHFTSFLASSWLEIASLSTVQPCSEQALLYECSELRVMDET